MRRNTCIALLAAALCVAGPLSPRDARCSDPPGAYDDRSTELLDEALRAIVMTRSDLSFRTDYADAPDSFRLSVVDSLLRRPLDTELYVIELAEQLHSAESQTSRLRTCAAQLDLQVEPADRMPEGRDPVEVLLAGIRSADLHMREAFSGLSPEESAFIAGNAPALLEEEEFDPDKPIDVREREDEIEAERGKTLLEIAGRVDYGSVAAAGLALAEAVDAALPLLDDWEGPELAPAGELPATGGAWGGDVLLVLRTDVGTVVVGGPGPTVYNAECAVSIDLGGDDLYLERATRAEGTGNSCVHIDVSGDDLYRTGDHSAGGGFMCAGYLVDLEGDDLYTGGNFAQGSGLFGVGYLDDRGGNDTYVADTCTQGSGAFGIGLLADGGGNDSYEAALFSQAFGFVEGIGVLVDRRGNDTYVAGGKYTDEIRYFDHYLSLSQGFGYGWRPDASGGVGVLADASGNDVYVSDIFGQGSSYWFAVGGLVDAEGNDEYVSYQYAQGAGTHITVAALAELSGDDNYVSKGVSQGCGHDLAIGILHDHAGDDNYACHDLSQGAGNANGIGVIMDDSGDDTYSVRNPDNTNGYGNFRRDYGSVGIHIDCLGTDSYNGRGADGEWWMGSDHGIGVDSNEREEESE